MHNDSESSFPAWMFVIIFLLGFAYIIMCEVQLIVLRRQVKELGGKPTCSFAMPAAQPETTTHYAHHAATSYTAPRMAAGMAPIAWTTEPNARCNPTAGAQEPPVSSRECHRLEDSSPDKGYGMVTLPNLPAVGLISCPSFVAPWNIRRSASGAQGAPESSQGRPGREERAFA